MKISRVCFFTVGGGRWRTMGMMDARCGFDEWLDFVLDVALIFLHSINFISDLRNGFSWVLKCRGN